jgi:hypothetical protein
MAFTLLWCLPIAGISSEMYSRLREKENIELWYGSTRTGTSGQKTPLCNGCPYNAQLGVCCMDHVVNERRCGDDSSARGKISSLQSMIE